MRRSTGLLGSTRRSRVRQDGSARHGSRFLDQRHSDWSASSLGHRCLNLAGGILFGQTSARPLVSGIHTHMTAAARNAPAVMEKAAPSPYVTARVPTAYGAIALTPRPRL